MSLATDGFSAIINDLPMCSAKPYTSPQVKQISCKSRDIGQKEAKCQNFRHGFSFHTSKGLAGRNPCTYMSCTVIEYGVYAISLQKQQINTVVNLLGKRVRGRK